MKHCWTGRSEWIEKTYGYLSDEYLDDAANAYGDPNWCGTTCMLPAGHFGPHVWTPDDEIVLEIKPEVTVLPRPDGNPQPQHVAARGAAAD